MDLTGRKIGPIRIESLIGTGGMGDVYRGFDEKLERRVAVKVLREEYSPKREARARFLREARILSHLRHPGICQIYDLVEGPETDVLVLEYIEGETLRRLAGGETNGTFTSGLDEADKLGIAVTVAEALDVAHREGIVHRDLKPDNIMVTPERQVKILDFGIARYIAAPAVLGPDSREPGPAIRAGSLPQPLSAEETTVERSRPQAEEPDAVHGADADATLQVDNRWTFLTPHQAMIGTAAYMSPEQAHQRPVTAASDMFTFGLVLQELFTGRRAYPRMPLGALLLRVSNAETRPVEGVEPTLAILIEDLKDPNPNRRPSASEARDRLVAILEHPARERHRRKRLAIAATAVVLTLGSLALAASSRFQARRQTAAAQRFGEEARDIEWLLRTVYLRPPEDIRTTRSEIHGRVAGLRSLMGKIGRAGRGPGEFALGRTALALGDLEAARDHLEAAWSTGYRPPEVAAALGLVLVELYLEERSRVVRIPDSKERARLLSSLKAELRDPGLSYLDLNRQAEIEALDDGGPVLRMSSIEYAEALIAFSEERYDDALAEAEAATRKLSSFYEGQALFARILQARGEVKRGRGDYDGALEDFRRARQAFLKAAEIGRGDPALYLGLCDLAASEMALRIYDAGGDVEPAFRQGVEACETALEIDADRAAAHRLLANLYFRKAEADEGTPWHLLTLAAKTAREALARSPDDASTWTTLGNIFLVRANWELFGGQDPRDAVGAALAAYGEAHELAPADARVLNTLGNAHSLLAEYEKTRGRDPRPSIADSVAAYRRATELGPDQYFFFTNMAAAYRTRAEYEVALGLDPQSSLALARQALARTRELNPNFAGAFRAEADLALVEARSAISRGGDPLALLEGAAEACRRALELLPRDVYAGTTQAAIWQTRGDYELRQTLLSGAGRGAGEAENSLAQALEAARRTLETGPNLVAPWTVLGAAHRGLGELTLYRGGDPREHIREAQDALDRALELDSEHAGGWLERGRVATLEGRFAGRLGEDAEEAWSRAERAFAKLAELRPGKAEAELAHLAHARGSGARGTLR